MAQFNLQAKPPENGAFFTLPGGRVQADGAP